MRNPKDEALSWCEKCGKRKANTLEDTVRLFFEMQDAKSFEMDLWRMYEDATASVYQEDYSPEMKGDQAFFFRYLLEFIRKLDFHNQLNETMNEWLLEQEKR